MDFNSSRYILRQGFVSLKRNIWLSLTSILTVTISIVLLGSSIIFLANMESIAKTLESQLQIGVFLDDQLLNTQITDIQNEIKGISGVSTVTFTSKEQAIVDFQKSLRITSLLEDLDGVNPLPDKITIVANNPNLVQGIAAQVQKISGVGDVSYGHGILEKLIAFTNWLRWIGVAVVAVFGFASLLLISLSIKTNVNSRGKEIQIMRLVGASNSLVRWPFIIEGLIIGLLGALIAMIIIGFSFFWLQHSILGSLAFIPVVTGLQFILQVLAVMLLTGMIMGALASVFSVRKFLHF